MRLALKDRGSFDLDRDGGQRAGGGAVDNRAVLDAVLAAVTRAVDGPVRDDADDAALMRANRGERPERPRLRLRDHDVPGGDDLAPAIRDLGGGGKGTGRGCAARGGSRRGDGGRGTPAVAG